MGIDTSALFAPIVINGHTVKNRLSVAPMTRVTATEDGRPTETMTRYYERFARGGFGAVSTEGIYTDQAFSQGYANQPGMTDEAQANAWKPVVSGIKAHGALAIAQIMHAGAISQGNRFRDTTVGPSSIQPKGEQMAFYNGKGRYALPVAIADAQIADAIHGFAESAGRAIEVAGFDAIEIHGANGYLLDQFLTDYANDRADRWGGPTENRVRLILETFKAVRAKVGAKVPVGVRISQGKVNDYHHKWADAERDAEIIFGSLAEAGADFIHVTEFEAWKPAFAPEGPSLMRLAKRYAPKAAIFANGGLHNIEQAVAALDDGADIVTIARGALANPDLPKRLSDRSILKDFDPTILGPIANIKESELAM
ncbi:NADH:flavin oxidoreductase [Sphingobium sp. TA15]|uniref:Putative oxidoreductase n=1 Tax=Sphingobium indicum (strain DSM 16413 / CCM 7287 / MTCC 6362 / UT26 / NBRC 101211 / UT26S) TaxID=452662 RepID=D4Z2H9_SPHIU|nr:NADH:flavin oxidoreductase [Sphingobium indicum]BAI96811.1 putative oxidoreductase [Sphingobium indicum UT26S]BDD66247.1 NADH:flavin oxidoreductase [Sphingobium sp. TA15]